MKVVARIILGFTFLVGVAAFIFLGTYSSANLSEFASVYYILGGGGFIVAALSAYLFTRKEVRVPIAIIVLVAFFLLVLFGLSSLNCSSRCISEDYSRIPSHAVSSALRVYHRDNNIYPESLGPLLDGYYLNKNTDISQLEYKRIGNSYELCYMVSIHYFFGIQIDHGKRICKSELQT